MNSDHIKVINYYSTKTKRFAHWVRIHDYRPSGSKSGRRGKKDFINFVSGLFGLLGERWTYQKESDHSILLKFDQERDLLIFLLKFKQR